VPERAGETVRPPRSRCVALRNEKCKKSKQNTKQIIGKWKCRFFSPLCCCGSVRNYYRSVLHAIVYSWTRRTFGERITLSIIWVNGLTRAHELLLLRRSVITKNRSRARNSRAQYRSYARRTYGWTSFFVHRQIAPCPRNGKNLTLHFYNNYFRSIDVLIRKYFANFAVLQTPETSPCFTGWHHIKSQKMYRFLCEINIKCAIFLIPIRNYALYY